MEKPEYPEKPMRNGKTFLCKIIFKYMVKKHVELMEIEM
jgi:hypothetical protein